MEVIGRIHAQATLFTGEEKPCTLSMNAGREPETVWPILVKKDNPLPVLGFDRLIVQPVI